MATPQQVRRRGRWTLVLGTVLAALIVGAVVAYADNTLPDGDGTTPVAANPLAFGNVSCGVAADDMALVAINRNGAAGSTNVFKDGSTVTVSVLSVSGTGLSASMGSPNTITLPSNWGTLANNTKSDSVSSTVTINSTTPGPGSGTVTYRSTGLNSSNATINRDATMDVTWTTGSCATAPEADAGGPYTTDEGAPGVQLDATGSTGTGLTYAWSVDTTGIDAGGTCSFDNAASAQPTITCDDDSNGGTFSVSVTVTDSSNNTDTASALLTVNNVKPTVTLSSGNSTDENENASGTVFYNFSVSDPGSNDTYTVTFVQCGTAGGATAIGQTPTSVTCQFYDGFEQTETVKVRVKDDEDALSDFATQDVLVHNVAPTVAITAGPSTVNEDAGANVVYTFGVYDPAGLNDPYTVEFIQCGTAGGGVAIGSTQTTVTCQFYDGFGQTETVKVRVRDDDLAYSNFATLDVTVNNVKPTIGSFSVTGTTGAACLGGNTVNVSFDWTDPAALNDTPFATSVAWGDSNTSSNSITGNPLSDSFSHTYSAGGPYTLTAKVEDGDGAASLSDTKTHGPFSFVYNTSGILEPINTTGTRSSFKIGSTIPVKIKVTDCNGANVSTLSLHVKLQKLDNSANPVNETVETSNPDVGDLMRWDATGQQYIYNLSTKKSQLCTSTNPNPCDSTGNLTAGTYRITVYGSGINSTYADIDTK